RRSTDPPHPHPPFPLLPHLPHPILSQNHQDSGGAMRESTRRSGGFGSAGQRLSRRTLRLAAPAVIFPLAACSARGGGPAGDVAMPGDADTHTVAHAHGHAQAQGHGHGHGHGSLPATPGPGYTVADVRFMQDMIGHHEQAIVMAAMAVTHGASEPVQVLARKMDISQRDEIELMEQWLIARGQVVPDEEYRRTMHMPGMLTPEQMAQLDAARGREFDRLFLL